MCKGGGGGMLVRVRYCMWHFCKLCDAEAGEIVV